jgi:hypothetical protein
MKSGNPREGFGRQKADEIGPDGGKSDVKGMVVCPGRLGFSWQLM